MDGPEKEFRSTLGYRIWIDKEGKGHIRIVKRIIFRTLISLCRETYLALDRSHGTPPRIIYLPRSLYEVMSENVRGLSCSAVHAPMQFSS